jgi:predicted MFS family arabinose efflux permease
VTGPPGPARGTTDIGSLGMTKAQPRAGEAGTGAVTAGSGQASGSAGPVTPARGGGVVDRVVPAHLACRIGARAQAGERNAWPAVVSIALGTFVLVFSELIPVGLLADISGHLRVPIGTGGLMVVVPAVAAAVAAPLLTLCSARLERRAVLVGLGVLVVVSDVIGGIAPDIGAMLAARAVLGVCVGGFWVFGAGAAITLVSAQARGAAVAVVSSGIFIATVASLPAASLIGTLTTWRAAFAVAAVFAVIAVAAQLAAVPRLGADGRVRPRSLLTVVTLPVSRIGLVAAGALFFANFAAYTYIGPLLHARAGLGASAITLVLLGFGLAGAAGNFTAGVTVRAHLRATLTGLGPANRRQRAAARHRYRRTPADHRAGSRLGRGLRSGAGGRAELDGPGHAGQHRRRPGPVRLRAARLAGRRLGSRRRDLRRQGTGRRARAGRGRRGRWVTGPAGPGRREHQLSAGELRRSGPRAGPGSAGTVARRDRWSREHRTTTTLKLPFAAIPAAARKELPCPTRS